MKKLNIPVEQFINAMFNANETVNLRVFDDRKGGVFKGQKLSVKAGRLDNIMSVLKEHNKQNRGIFFVVNSGGNADNEINKINAQFMEMDEGSFEEQWEKINAFPLPPSLVVKTRKSLHCYWLVSNGSVAKFRNIQQALVKQFDGDKTCVNESRVLRLPNFYHCKQEPVMVDAVKFNPELKYTQVQLENALPKIENKQEQKARPTAVKKRVGLNLIRRCDFIKHCKDDATTLSEHDWYAMITNLASFEGGVEMIHALSKEHPNYSEQETNDKINHYLESKTAPMTCKNICEKGFICSKCKDGSCGVKSPAGLAYKPYSSAEIKEMVEYIEISSDVVENMELATVFIKRHMYNMDKLSGETVIENYVSKRFKLKTENTKRLLAVFKDISKSYKARKERNIDDDKQEVEWYEETDRGSRFMPAILAKHLAENENVFHAAEKYFRYKNGVYRPITESTVKRLVQSKLNIRTATSAQIRDTTDQWMIQVEKQICDLNANPFIINCKNGLYNVLDDSFNEHTSTYLSTVQINPNYDPSAKCDMFMNYMHDCFAQDEINLVQEILGYLLIPVSKAQKCFVFTGVAHAGKSILLDLITDTLLGAEQVSHIMWQQLGDRFKTAELFGKLANTFADLPTNNIDENSMFKAITGQDYVTAEEKNKKPFSFKPYSRLVFSCNEVPKNYADRSEGFYRRLIIIPFERAIPIEKRDESLADKLKTEADGILNFAIAGLKRLMENRYVFGETAKTKLELERYRIESNSALIFIDEMCKIEKDAKISSPDLYKRYQDYCTDSGLKPMSQTNFNKVLENISHLVYKGKTTLGRNVIWIGIRYLG